MQENGQPSVRFCDLALEPMLHEILKREGLWFDWDALGQMRFGGPFRGAHQAILVRTFERVGR